MRIGSLCSGYGGLDLGVQAAIGGTVAWHVEHDAAPSRILAHHWPDTPNHGDVKTTDWSTVEPVDVLTAGYPCQPFSHAGKRKGTDDPRHLWPDVARAIGALRPRLVVLENVRGHVSLGLDAVIGDLSSLGYDARWLVVRAADAGAPHGRGRVFIVAAPHADALGLERSGRAWGRRCRPADGGVAPADSARIGWGEGRPEPAGFVWRPDAVERRGPTAPDASRERYGRGQDRRGVGRLDGADAGTPRERERPRPVAVDRGSATTADPNRGGLELVRRLEPEQRDTHGRGSEDVAWGNYEPAIRRWEHALGRPAPDPTEPGRNGPRLAPVFVEWLMGLDPGHVTDPAIGLTRNQQLKALGNGVVPQQAALALSLLLGT